jgi:hypothetical protein
MAKISAIECDLKTCGKLGVPDEGAEIPVGWFLVDIYEQGEGNLEARTLCSWACIANFANNRIQAPQRRKRRTRAEIEADEARGERVVPIQQ